MNGTDWPGLHLVRDELDQVPRRDAFTDAHPGAQFDRKGDVYIGHAPYVVDGEERSITIRSGSWRALLDALETYFDEAPDTG